MINLLPPNEKATITYARRNARLARMSLSYIGAAFIALLLIGAGQWYLAQSTNRYKTQISQAEANLASQNLAGTKKEIKELSDSMNLILKVLSQEILFSKILRQAGSVMPVGSSLTTLEISGVQGGVDIVAGVDNYQVGTQVQINLADPDNKIFEKVDLVSVRCDTSNEDSVYPCTANLRALFGDNSPYLFINRGKGSAR